MRRRLLIVTCSRRKSGASGRIPAWERYEGGCFPVLKEIKKELSIPDDLDIIIVSGKYGILRPTDPIEWYDQKMTQERVAILRPSIEETLSSFIKATEYYETFIFLEKAYLASLETIEFPCPIYVDASKRENLIELRNWILKITG